MQMERASKKQQELLSFVDGFIKGNGYGPSYREIMRALGYKSVSTVAIHIDGLIAKGYLARRDNSARSLEVVTTRTAEVSEKHNDETEQKLIAKLRTTDLTDDDRQIVMRAFKLLGYEKAARSLTAEGDEDAKNSNS